MITFSILEDDYETAESLKKHIAMLDIESKAFEAKSYKAGIDIAKKIHIDVFLVDINLMGKETGIDFVREIRKIYHKKTPILIISSMTEMKFKLKAFEEFNIAGYIDKPYISDEVVEKLEDSVEMAKLIDNKKVTFSRKDYSRTYFVRDVYAVHRVPKKDRQIKVISYDEETNTIVEEIFKIDNNLDEVLDLFDQKDALIRCHQSWLVNPKQIKAVNYSTEKLILPHDIKIPMGNSYRGNIEEFI